MHQVLPTAMSTLPRFRRVGKVTRITEVSVESHGPAAALGVLCELRTQDGQALLAEVVGMHDDIVVLMPYGPCRGLVLGAEVVALDEQPHVPVGAGLLGRVVDALGKPLDDLPLSDVADLALLHPRPVNPLKRQPIRRQLETGVRALDALLPLGEGQRMGIFAGSGVGKSSLMGMLAQHMDAEISVVALIGERGREVREFLEQRLSPEARKRSVIVVATADQPAVLRARAAYAATAVAEYFRACGKRVLLMMDSITRFAMARREIDLAAGQPPTARGYTPSVFSAIPALCERCGGLEGQGSITALYTVLVEGDDVNEPVADALRATLDGHVVLSRALANEGHFPAIDVLHSISRLDNDLLSKAQYQSAQALRSLLAVHQRQREMVDMGLYKEGSNTQLDKALAQWSAITDFLRQAAAERSERARTTERLKLALGVST